MESDRQDNQKTPEKHIKPVSQHLKEYSLRDYISAVPYALVLYPFVLKENMVSKN